MQGHIPPKLIWKRDHANTKTMLKIAHWTRAEIELMETLMEQYGNEYGLYMDAFQYKFSIRDIKQMYKQLACNVE